MGDVPTIKKKMETLDQQINNAFNSLTDFRPRFGIGDGFGCFKRFPNGLEISIQCSSFNYCSPREDLNSPNDYSSFEVSVNNANGDLVTSDFFEDVSNDQMKGWASREEILLAICRIINTN